jgi:replicative DNA helicase
MEKRGKYNSISDLLLHSKLPPQAVSEESAVLGALMLESTIYSQVSNILKSESFYKESHQKIYTAIQDLVSKSEPIDILTVTNQLKTSGQLEVVGGAYYIATLTNRVASSANIQYHAAIVYQKWLQREIIRIGSQITKDAYEDSIDVFDLLENLMQQCLELRNIKTDKITTLAKELKILYEHIENNKNFEITTTGTLTGIYSFDKHTGGFQRSDLIIIGGETSHGKTSLIMQMTKGACMSPNVRGAVYSLEMTNQQLTARLLASESGVDYSKLLYSKISSDDSKNIDSGINSLPGANIYFDAAANNDIVSIINSLHALKIKYDITFAVVDYLQMISFKNTKLEGEAKVGEICRLLKECAKELNITIILLCQFNRGEVQNHKYTLASLKGSGMIEQAADIVIFISVPELWNDLYFTDNSFSNIKCVGKARIEVAKGRNVGQTKFILWFDRQINKFRNYNRDEDFD